MNLLIISNILPDHIVKRSGENICNIVEVIKWNDSQIQRYLDDYHVIILDYSFEDEKRLGDISKIYVKLLNKIEIYIKNPKVVIVICGVIQSKIFSDDTYGKVYYYTILRNLLSNLYIESDATGELFYLKPDRFNSIDKYFDNVTNYTTQFILQEGHEESRKIAVIDESKFIAAEISLKQSILLLLPGYDHKKIDNSINSLVLVAKDYHEKISKKIFDPGLRPDWTDKYMLKKHKEIKNNIIKLEEERDKFEIILSLLYTNGLPLEHAVIVTLQDLGFKVEKTVKDYPVDLKASYGENIKFAIEITGTSGKIRQKDKIPQILKYRIIQEDEGKSDEKILLIVNTYMNKDLKDRKDNINFTDDVKRLLDSMETIYMTSADLFNLWRLVKENKIDADKMVEAIIGTKIGEFKMPMEFENFIS